MTYGETHVCGGCSVTVHADKQRQDEKDIKDAFQTHADYCLMATGRKPNTKNLGLEEVCCASLPCTRCALAELETSRFCRRFILPVPPGKLTRIAAASLAP